MSKNIGVIHLYYVTIHPILKRKRSRCHRKRWSLFAGWSSPVVRFWLFANLDSLAAMSLSASMSKIPEGRVKHNPCENLYLEYLQILQRTGAGRITPDGMTLAVHRLGITDNIYCLLYNLLTFHIFFDDSKWRTSTKLKGIICILYTLPFIAFQQ